MLATLTKQSALALDKKEADALGAAIANVAKFYDTGVMSPKTLAWMNVAQTVGMVYGPRLFVMRAQADARRAAARAAAGAPENGAAPSDPTGTPFDGTPATVRLV